MSRVFAVSGGWTAGAALLAVLACAFVLSLASPGNAQSAARAPQFDPNQAQKNIDAIEVEQKRARNTGLQVPKTPKPEPSTDTRPLLRLAAVSVDGAHAIAGDAIAATYRPYLGKTVSNADLSKIAGMIS